MKTVLRSNFGSQSQWAFQAKPTSHRTDICRHIFFSDAYKYGSRPGLGWGSLFTMQNDGMNANITYKVRNCCAFVDDARASTQFVAMNVSCYCSLCCLPDLL
jgi:hypothetical protein